MILIFRLGTYAIISEMVEVPFERPEFTWVFVAKIIGYIVSIICLIIFIATIQINRLVTS